MQQHDEALLRLPEVLKKIPVGRSAWYAGIKAGRFPAPIKLSERVSVWRASDISRLIQSIVTDQPR